MFDLHHTYNMRRIGFPSQDTPLTTFTQGTGKSVLVKEKEFPEVEYNLIDDLKKDKTNIYLYKLLKIPSIREILPRT